MTIKEFFRSPFRTVCSFLGLEALGIVLVIAYYTAVATPYALIALIPWVLWFGVIFFSMFLPIESKVTKSWRVFFGGYPQAFRNFWEEFKK